MDGWLLDLVGCWLLEGGGRRKEEGDGGLDGTGTLTWKLELEQQASGGAFHPVLTHLPTCRWECHIVFLLPTTGDHGNDSTRSPRLIEQSVPSETFAPAQILPVVHLARWRIVGTTLDALGHDLHWRRRHYRVRFLRPDRSRGARVCGSGDYNQLVDLRTGGLSEWLLLCRAVGADSDGWIKLRL